MPWPKPQNLVNRRDAAQAMAKVIAYLNVSKQPDAEHWFRHLAMLLKMGHLLK